MILLGVDVGTTRIKALAYSPEQSRVLATSSVATPVHATPHGSAHDPAEIHDEVLRCLDTVLGRLPDRADVAGVCVVSLGEEVVLVDETGTPLGPTPTWYDSPGRAWAAQYPRPVNPTFSLFTLRWFSEQRPDLAAATARFTDLGSFVAARLSGRAAELVMDRSHASRTGFFDLRGLRVDSEALAWAGDWVGRAPRLVASGEVIGTLAAPIARDLRLPGDIAVVSGAHDHFAAAFASGVRRAGDAMLSAGTSEALLVLASSVPDDALDVDRGAFVDDRHVYVHRNVLGGALFDRWRTLLGLDGEPDASWFRPDSWTGTPGPRCAVHPRSGTTDLTGLPFDVQPTAVMRAVSEGLAVNCRTMLADLERAAGIPVRSLTVAGPPGAGDAWVRMRAAVLDRPLRVVRTPEPTALGAALLAQRALCGTADLPVDVDTIAPAEDDDERGYYERLRQLTAAPGPGAEVT